MKIGLASTLTALAVALLPGAATAVTINHTFDANNQGWLDSWSNTCTDPPVAATWVSSGGNPGGAIRAQESDTGIDCPTFFIGAPGVAGNLIANYGGTVVYDLRATGAPTRNRQIALTDFEGKSLAAAIGPPPAANAWTTFSASLVETDAAGWEFLPAGASDPGSATPATRANFFDVLANVDSVSILADMRTNGGGDEVLVDNFMLLEPPAPLDTDGDGIFNASDNCPLEAGPLSSNGCPGEPPANPDPDGDGLIGAVDKCPDQAGPASNDGCPKGTNPPGGDAACDKAKQKLAKAKAKLKKLKENDAKAAKIKKAKAKVKKAKTAVKEAC
jgi:hypothetical protein